MQLTLLGVLWYWLNKMTFYVKILLYRIMARGMMRSSKQGGIMNEVKGRIKALSTAIVVILAFIVVVSSLSVLYGIKGLTAETLAFSELHNQGVWLMRQALITILLAYLAFVFLRIRREETPFFKQLPREIKIASVLIFAAFVLPQWVGYAIKSFVTGTYSFVVLDETGILALGLAFTVYCFGQIFQYGLLVQNENNEIV